MRRGQGDFVGARFPEPHNPIVRANWMPETIPGMGSLSDFVYADFPEPHNPIARRGVGGCGGSCGGSCAGCGMGAWYNDEPGWTKDFPSFARGKVADIPKIYWGAGILVVVAVVLPMVMGGGGRRRRR